MSCTRKEDTNDDDYVRRIAYCVARIALVVASAIERFSVGEEPLEDGFPETPGEYLPGLCGYSLQ
jgi:hypothetical protein